MTQPVLLDQIDQVAVITFNRPERHNSLIPSFLEQILAALESIRSQVDTKTVILRANGRSFSTGGDVSGFYENLQNIDNYADTLVGLLNQAILGILDLPLPVVACVHGIVTGGSLGFVLASDLVLVTPKANFTPYYSLVGFSPDGGWTAMLPRIIGMRRSAETLMHNKTISADQAVAWGLANQIVPDENLFETALEIAQDLALKHQGSIVRTKSLLRGWLGNVDSGLQAEKSEFIQQIATEEARFGMEAFLKK